MNELIAAIHDYLFMPERVPYALGAWLVTVMVGMITGPMHGNAHPFIWFVIDKMLGGLGARLNKKHRETADLVFRGFLLTALALAFAWVFGNGALWLSETYSFSGVTEIILLSLALTSGTVWFTLLRLYFTMKENKISKGAYLAIARSTRIDLSASDDYGITRAGMGFAARSFDKGLVAPVIWYLIAGLPGAYIYAFLAALAWRFGKNGFTKGFGRVPLALEKLMGFIPTLLAGFLMAAAGLFTPTGGMTRALIGQMTAREGATYEQGGPVVAAMAYSLNVSLGGPVTDLDGNGLGKAWIGPKNATAQLSAGHLRRGLYITLMAHGLFVASLGAAMFWGNFLS